MTPRRLDPPPARIAVLRALFLGDLLCASPALRALRRRFPAAEITLIGLPWAADLAARWPYLDRFAPFPGWPGLAEVPFDPVRTEAFLAAARGDRFDLAIQMHGSGPASNGFVAALGARETVGYSLTADARLTACLPWTEEEHEIRRWLRLVALTPRPPFPRVGEGEQNLSPQDWGVGGDGGGAERPDFPTTPAERRRARALLAAAPPGDGPLVALHPGAKDAARRWPPERFAALGDALAARWGARLLLTGGDGERALTAAVRSSLRARSLDLAGTTDLGTFAALIAGLDLLVTNDTGASHLAAAAGTRSVVLFGPSRPGRWAPLDRERHSVIDAAALGPAGPRPGDPLPGGEQGRTLASLPVEPVLTACVDALAHTARPAQPPSPQDRVPESRAGGAERIAGCAP